MSEPAIFVFIRNGESRAFGDRWAGATLCREIFWGPDELEKWAIQLEPADAEEVQEFGVGAIVDFDNGKMTWSGDTEKLAVPAVRRVFNELLRANWPRFEVKYCDSLGDGESEYPEDGENDFISYRPENVAEAGRVYENDDDDEYDEEDEDEPTFDPDETRAWVTLVDGDQNVRHRNLESLPANILSPKDELIDQLAGLPPAEIPGEKLVSEGMWIDVGNNTIGIWGGSDLKSQLENLEKAWPGWAVSWADNGYLTHCRETGVDAIEMTKSEALAEFLPLLLSTQRFDMNTFVDAIGGGLKKKAMQATGCLLILICLPILIFGLFSGNWTAVGWTILTVVLLVVIAFKVIEYRIKSKFKKNIPLRREPESSAPPVAGQLDKTKREQSLNELLSRAGYPTCVDVKSQFPDDFDDEFNF